MASSSDKRYEFHIKSDCILGKKTFFRVYFKQSRQQDFEIFPCGPNQGGATLRKH